MNVANIILAEVRADVDPGALAIHVRSEVQAFWMDIATSVRQSCNPLIAEGVDEVWAEQIETFLEFTAAWAPMADGYKVARDAVAQAIGARKVLRDFEPWTAQRSGRQGPRGVPKSSLDGARETILKELKDRSKEARKLANKYRIADAEQLDAIGLIKRSGGETAASKRGNELQFTPLINVALAPWLQEARTVDPGSFKALEAEAGSIGLPRVTRKLPCAEAFPFDAGIFLDGQLFPTFEEQGIFEEESDDRRYWRQRVSLWRQQFIEPILKAQSGAPYPYVACLVADGDRVGKAIDTISGGSSPQDAHRRFSEELSKFASEARRVVEQRHLGSLVYSGGDDVLAFLPASTAIACAAALRITFEQCMQRAFPNLNASELPTLSVGIGIGHVLESMGELLELGRAAERSAKGKQLAEGLQRDALAIIVEKRSGGRWTWRTQWGEQPDAILAKDIGALKEKSLSSRKIFEINNLLRRLPEPAAIRSEDDIHWAALLNLEIDRSLKRIDGGSKPTEAAAVNLRLQEIGYADNYRSAREWIDRLLIARLVAVVGTTTRDSLAGAL